MVGAFDDIHVVFDDDQRMSPTDEGIESFQQFLYVMEMQACGRFIEHEDGRLCLFDAEEVRQFHALVCLFDTEEVRQFYALVFSSREGRRRLSQLDVTQSHIL